jgi:hypothetical protein
MRASAVRTSTPGPSSRAPINLFPFVAASPMGAPDGRPSEASAPHLPAGGWGGNCRSPPHREAGETADAARLRGVRRSPRRHTPALKGPEGEAHVTFACQARSTSSCCCSCGSECPSACGAGGESRAPSRRSGVPFRLDPGKDQRSAGMPPRWPVLHARSRSPVPALPLPLHPLRQSRAPLPLDTGVIGARVPLPLSTRDEP